MAVQIPLNKFVLVTKTLRGEDEVQVYQTPVGVSSVVLSFQISNVMQEAQDTEDSITIDLIIDRSGTEFFLVKEAVIPVSEALNPLSGKLVLQEGDIVKLKPLTGDGLPESSEADIVLSVLENANE